jgi:N-acetylmuramoyl-L-alanine amidase
MQIKNSSLITKIKTTILTVATAVLLSTAIPTEIFAAPACCESSVPGQKIILVDPGHGGIDGGAVAKSGILEKDINLLIGKKLKAQLEKQGYKVIMSREEDMGLYTDEGRIRKKKIEDLENRLKLKKESNCDMFISVHLNAFPETQYYGAQVWYGGNEESRKFAAILQRTMREQLDKENKRVQKPAGNAFRILRDNGSTAAVLVECGFLSNAAEEAKLKTGDYQQKIADAISKAVDEYFAANKQ